jgi:hypothetical protein
VNDPAAGRQRPTWVDPTLYPFTDHCADVAGCRLHYVDEGEGPVLLLLHGNPTWSLLYRTIILRLRSRFRCCGRTATEARACVGDRRHLGLAGRQPYHGAVLEDPGREARAQPDPPLQPLRARDLARRRQAAHHVRLGQTPFTSQFPDRESRIPTAVFPREILGSRAYLERVERDLPTRYSAGSLPHSSDLAPAAGFESPLPPVAPARAE